MVAVAPFRALRFDPARVDLRRVTSPPHDVVSPAARAAFAADPHSIVHVILPEEAPGNRDAPATPNRHERAAALLEAWKREGTLRRDDRPALYLYEATHPLGPGGPRVTMRGVLCRLRLDPDYREVRRHEKTLPGRKRDRLQLRMAARCDVEPIWLLYRDPRGWVDEVLSSNAHEELASFTDEEGHHHRLWRVDRPQAVGEVVAQFEDRHLVIADGHHRYQTALDHAAQSGDPRDASILACLVRDDDPGLRIAATHRLVSGLGRPDAASLVAAAGRHWDATPLAAGADVRGELARLAPSGRELLVAARASDGARLWRLRLRPGSEVDEGRGLLDRLAVTRAHDRLLRDAWGLDPERPEDHLRFTRSPEEAVAAVASGAAQAAVLLPAESPASVLQVAEEGHLMPQKATFFVPKLRSGLVLGPLDEPLPAACRETAGDGGPAAWRLPPLG